MKWLLKYDFSLKNIWLYGFIHFYKYITEREREIDGQKDKDMGRWLGKAGKLLMTMFLLQRPKRHFPIDKGM